MASNTASEEASKKAREDSKWVDGMSTDAMVADEESEEGDISEGNKESAASAHAASGDAASVLSGHQAWKAVSDHIRRIEEDLVRL